MMSFYLNKVTSGENLSEEESYQCMQDIIGGYSNQVEMATLLTALSMKGETIAEITGFVKAMREAAIKVNSSRKPLVDTCGTGGDTLKTFNVSTAAALIAASCGVTIAKHGNRSITSKCGGADILEAMGVNINCDAAGVEKCLDRAGIGFMFAPLFHPAMKKVAPVRKNMGIRTVFNILGPLTSPACADIQLLGVFDPELVGPVAQVLRNLKVKRALVVHGYDQNNLPAMDEISILGKTKMAFLEGDHVQMLEIYPEDFGLRKQSKDHITAPDNLTENLDIFCSVLSGSINGPEEEARLNLCLMNAAAILFIAGKAVNFKEGTKMALKSIKEGAALDKLHEFIQISNGIYNG
ncbi:MAG: anthranilate phosphoribosyltransferase [Methanobacterium sp.]|nr:anthranilate phosphoribosyltransferase [Methanobacterium sp.]